ncbi:MAG: hypothetical protein MRY83_14455, partial [Flavobacteriales bacterium]|nr:hypothetical protein [Flavobacteriales bacterium]
ILKLEDIQQVFFYSDGLPDQFSPNDLKFGNKRFTNIVLENNDLMKIKSEIIKKWTDWKGDTRQLDDVLLIGLEF